ncbi:GDSL-like Lipase/Acylhydrolase family protein [Mycobacterium kansasii 824]|nr:GDSL-like Lipase/Acylhydrolase family protein [Mycobacterium kansasii 824]
MALGSSMAAGPGIRPRADGAPWRSGRSARNYPHLVAEQQRLKLVDVTYSGATTANVLGDHQHGAPPQITALDGSESLVTVTIGGNDVGYIPLLMAAALPRPARRLPLLGAWIAELLDRNSRDQALAQVFDSLCEVGRSLRRRAPRSRVLFVDYLTLLPRRACRLRRCPRRTANSAATSPQHWNGLPPTPPRSPVVRSCAPRRPAATTTHGRPSRGRKSLRGSGCRYRRGRRRCTPMPPGCARWRNSLRPNCKRQPLVRHHW